MVLVWRTTGKAKLSGVPLDQRIAVLALWRDGKVWRAVAYADPAEALEAAGIQE